MSDIIGTEGDDALVGTEQDDSIDGLGGNDTLEGRGGDDALGGGAGHDQKIRSAPLPRLRKPLHAFGSDVHDATPSPADTRNISSTVMCPERAF